MSPSAANLHDTIALCGPSMELGSAGYGGGKGGFVRNVAALLGHFSERDVKMTLSPYSTRRFSRWWKTLLPFRLIADLLVFARNIRHGGAVHVMMTYGLAIYREFGMSVIAAAVKRPQAVLERVGDLKTAYFAMRAWLAPGGWLSHQVDFRCHGTAREWNGHWTYGDMTWRMLRGRRTYLINREPHSTHICLLCEAGFTVVCDEMVSRPAVDRRSLAPRFAQMSDVDLTTSGAFIQAQAGG
jgi:hypothetical protein